MDVLLGVNVARNTESDRSNCLDARCMYWAVGVIWGAESIYLTRPIPRHLVLLHTYDLLRN